ncbi:MAG TPA: protein phosphatase 2C domain-containing protein [bacterium]|mgnify:FL=1|jgi:serine/threonine protein phosphatase PrpC|nr:protein phosphatase 2C domain-containing protein [bacterium]HQI04433.1 protein phosphatase 2C domain-containing protein [bacterium]
MKFLSFSLTDTGKKRRNNEDAFINMAQIGLFAVADGMGGEQCGEIASQTAVDSITHFINENHAIIGAFEMNDSAENKTQVLNMLADSLRFANMKVFREAEKRNLQGKMGTTLTIFLAIDNAGFMVHAGDSRLYMIRGDEITQLSTDHTVSNDYKRQYGDAGEGFDERFAGILTKAVGIQEYVEPEKLTFTIVPFDRYLLCSDGLYNAYGNERENAEKLLMSREHDIEKESSFLSDAAGQLLDIAYENGASDNVSMVLVSAFSMDEEEVTGTKELIKKFDIVRNIDLFRNLDFKELLTVMERVEIRTYNRYDVISRIESPDRELFIILEGKVSSLRGSKHLKTFYEGDHIGEVAFLTEEKPQFNLFVDKPSSFLVIKRSVFIQMMNDNPALGVKLLWQLATVLARQTNSSIGLIKEE